MPLYQPACSSVACLPDTGAEPLAPSAARDAPYLPHAPTLSPRWSCPHMRVVPDVNTLSPRDSASSILRCRPRRATFRLPLWGLTLRRSRWALERRQRGEPSSPPARQKERGCDAALPPAPSRQQPPPLAVYVLSVRYPGAARHGLRYSARARRDGRHRQVPAAAQQVKEKSAGAVGCVAGPRVLLRSFFTTMSAGFTPTPRARALESRRGAKPVPWSRRSRTLCHRCSSSPRVAATAAAPSGDRTVCTSPPIRFTTFMAGDTHRAGCTCMESP